MLSLYEINHKIVEAFDNETGEQLITDEEMDKLFKDKETKLENIALLCKTLTAEAEAIKQEEANLKARRESKDRLKERLKRMLSENLNGERFDTTKVCISFRKSESVEIYNEEEFLNDITNKELIKEKITYTPDKNAIKDVLKKGLFVNGAVLKTSNNIQIK